MYGSIVPGYVVVIEYTTYRRQYVFKNLLRIRTLGPRHSCIREKVPRKLRKCQAHRIGPSLLQFRARRRRSNTHAPCERGRLRGGRYVRHAFVSGYLASRVPSSAFQHPQLVSSSFPISYPLDQDTAYHLFRDSVSLPLPLTSRP